MTVAVVPCSETLRLRLRNHWVTEESTATNDAPQTHPKIGLDRSHCRDPVSESANGGALPLERSQLCPRPHSDLKPPSAQAPRPHGLLRTLSSPRCETQKGRKDHASQRVPENDLLPNAVWRGHSQCSTPGLGQHLSGRKLLSPSLPGVLQALQIGRVPMARPALTSRWTPGHSSSGPRGGWGHGTSLIKSHGGNPSTEAQSTGSRGVQEGTI